LSKINNLGITFRGLLLGLQMLISVGLIASVFIVYQQLDFMMNRPLGLDKENKLVVRLNFFARDTNFNTIITELTGNPNINSVTMTDQIPGSANNGLSL